MTEGSFSRDTEFFSAVQTQAVVTFRFKKNCLLHATMFEAKDAVLGYLKHIAIVPEIKVVIIMGNTLCDDCEQYQQICAMIRSGELSEAAVSRLFRAVDQIMLALVNSDILFVGVISNETVPLLLGISLACDYRIAGRSMRVRNLYLEEGLLPKGGLPFFFGRRIGRSKALEWLLFHEQIDAQTCLDLGIVDRVVPDCDLEDEAMQTARLIAARPRPLLARLKRLLNRSLQGLPEYLEQENQELGYVLEQGNVEI